MRGGDLILGEGLSPGVSVQLGWRVQPGVGDSSWGRVSAGLGAQSVLLSQGKPQCFSSIGPWGEAVFGFEGLSQPCLPTKRRKRARLATT